MIDGAECDRCDDLASVKVETRDSIDTLCAGCATVVIREGLGILEHAQGAVCAGIRREWARSSVRKDAWKARKGVRKDTTCKS